MLEEFLEYSAKLATLIESESLLEGQAEEDLYTDFELDPENEEEVKKQRSVLNSKDPSALDKYYKEKADKEAKEHEQAEKERKSTQGFNIVGIVDGKTDKKGNTQRKFELEK